MKEERGIKLPNLVAWRKRKLLEQKELAEKAGITEATISRIENGSPARMKTIGKLAEALGITREQLVHEKPEAKRPAA